jgi:preprotein translocase subunit SecE
MFDRITTYFKEARQELRHVNWPTRAEAIRLTTIVIAISLGISIYLGIFDYAFQYALQHFVLHS